MRLIDADTLKQKMCLSCELNTGECIGYEYCFIMDIINDAMTVGEEQEE